MKILSICGSPRKGNSEAILFRIKELIEKENADNEIILLRERKISHCQGCVEYCNHKLECRIKDDMQAIMRKMEGADGFVFASPNYFKMPTGLFKNFIDRCSVFYTRACFDKGKKEQFKDKKTVVIVVGTDTIRNINVCLHNLTENFCKTLGLPVVGKKSFRSRSELKGNYKDIFENRINPNIEKNLEELVNSLVPRS